MRWKLLIAASLVAAVAGAGACLLAARFVPGTALNAGAPGAARLLLLLALPLGAVAAASIFVYRHTARRRPLQAAATALLSSLLTLAALAAGSDLLSLRAEPPAPSGLSQPLD